MAWGKGAHYLSPSDYLPGFDVKLSLISVFRSWTSERTCCLENCTEPALFCVDHEAEQRARTALPPGTSNAVIHVCGETRASRGGKRLRCSLHSDSGAELGKLRVSLPREFDISTSPAFLFRGRLTGFKQSFRANDAFKIVHPCSCRVSSPFPPHYLLSSLPY